METPWMKSKNIEFFVNEDGLFFMKDGAVHPFADLSIDLADVIADDLEANPMAVKALDEMGITDPVKRLEQYTRCRFGEFNGTSDIVGSKVIDSDEYTHCGQRGQCKWEGRLCCEIRATYGMITKTEIQIIKLVACDNTDKEIANALCRSQYTISKHIANILSKLGAHGRTRIGVFAVKHNLI